MSTDEPVAEYTEVTVKTEHESSTKQTNKNKTKKPKGNKESASAEELPASLLGEIASQLEPATDQTHPTASSSSSDDAGQTVITAAPVQPATIKGEVSSSLNAAATKTSKKRPNSSAEDEQVVAFGATVKRIRWSESSVTPAPKQATVSTAGFPLKPTAQPLARPSIFAPKSIA